MPLLHNKTSKRLHYSLLDGLMKKLNPNACTQQCTTCRLVVTCWLLCISAFQRMKNPSICSSFASGLDHFSLESSGRVQTASLSWAKKLCAMHLDSSVSLLVVESKKLCQKVRKNAGKQKKVQWLLCVIQSTFYVHYTLSNAQTCAWGQRPTQFCHLSLSAVPQPGNPNSLHQNSSIQTFSFSRYVQKLCGQSQVSRIVRNLSACWWVFPALPMSKGYLATMQPHNWGICLWAKNYTLQVFLE